MGGGILHTALYPCLRVQGQTYGGRGRGGIHKLQRARLFATRTHLAIHLGACSHRATPAECAPLHQHQCAIGTQCTTCFVLQGGFGIIVNAQRALFHRHTAVDIVLLACDGTHSVALLDERNGIATVAWDDISSQHVVHTLAAYHVV